MALLVGTLGVARGNQIRIDGPSRATSVELSGESSFWRREIHRMLSTRVTDPRPRSTWSEPAVFDIDDGPVDIVRFVEAPEDTSGW